MASCNMLKNIKRVVCGVQSFVVPVPLTTAFFYMTTEQKSQLVVYLPYPKLGRERMKERRKQEVRGEMLRTEVGRHKVKGIG